MSTNAHEAALLLFWNVRAIFEHFGVDGVHALCPGTRRATVGVWKSRGAISAVWMPVLVQRALMDGVAPEDLFTEFPAIDPTDPASVGL